MADRDDSKLSEDERDEDERDEDSSPGDEDSVPKSKAPVPSAKARSAKARPAANAAKPGGVASAQVALFVVIALAAGGAAGWFGQQAQAKSRLQAESAPAPSGSGAAAGPCGAWEAKLCASVGDTSSACKDAKAATALLTPSSCEVALSALPATITKVKAARASCDKLSSDLCKALPPGSKACDLVKQQTPSFPPQRCDEMLKHYDEVLTSLKQMDAQAGAMGGPGPGPGSAPHPGTPGGPGAHPPH